MIFNSVFKGRKAICVESDTLRATFLPDDGAKMASLVRLCDGKELLYVAPEKEYSVLSYDGDYVAAECSGFDDMFPTVDEYVPKSGAYRGVTYPDHGEACRLSYFPVATSDDVIMRSTSKIFPVSYEKRVRACQGGEIIISYRIDNHGDAPFDFLWAGHIMLSGEDGMRVVSPFNKGAPIKIMFAPNVVDEKALSLDGLSGFEPKTGAAYKFYYTERMERGIFGASYADGSKILFEVDEKKLPYLAFWLNNGEFKDAYTLTPEPASVPYDSPERAAENGVTSVIPPKGDFSFEIKIKITEKSI